MHKYLLYLTIALFLICSCSNSEEQSTIENVDLKKYFYQLKDFEKPKVLVYDQDSLGHQKTTYFRIEQIAHNELEVKLYDANFKYNYTLHDRFEDDGVYLSKTNYMDNGKEMEAEIVLGKIFTFNGAKPQSICEQIYKYSIPEETIIVNINSSELGEIVKKEFDGEMRNTIIAKGETMQEIAQEGKDAMFYRSPMEVWYTEGIGVTLIKSEYANGDITEKYSHTISIEEFERLEEMTN